MFYISACLCQPVSAQHDNNSYRNDNINTKTRTSHKKLLKIVFRKHLSLDSHIQIWAGAALPSHPSSRTHDMAVRRKIQTLVNTQITHTHNEHTHTNHTTHTHRLHSPTRAMVTCDGGAGPASSDVSSKNSSRHSASCVLLRTRPGTSCSHTHTSHVCTHSQRYIDVFTFSCFLRLLTQHPYPAPYPSSPIHTSTAGKSGHVLTHTDKSVHVLLSRTHV